MSIQVVRRSAAQEVARSEASRARKLTVDIAAIHEEIATLRGESSGLDDAGWAAQQEPSIAYEHLDVAQAERSPVGVSDSVLSTGRRRQVSVVQPQAVGADGSQAAGAARLSGQLSSTLSIKPHPSRSVDVQAPASTREENEKTAQLHDDSDEDFHDPKFDFHFPEPRYSKSRRASTTPEEVQLAATKLEAAELRLQLNRALGVDDAGPTVGETAGTEAVGGPLFEAFIIVGESVELAGQIKTACDW
eukprot:COSAG02_NODE_15072_length_1207_cov_1.528881_2_plen_247_part_00